MKKLIPLAALVFVLCGCKSATLDRTFDAAKSVAGIVGGAIDDTKDAVKTINDTFNSARSNIVSAVKGTNSVSAVK